MWLRGPRLWIETSPGSGLGRCPVSLHGQGNSPTCMCTLSTQEWMDIPGGQWLLVGLNSFERRDGIRAVCSPGSWSGILERTGPITRDKATSLNGLPDSPTWCCKLLIIIIIIIIIIIRLLGITVAGTRPLPLSHAAGRVACGLSGRQFLSPGRGSVKACSTWPL